MNQPTIFSVRRRLAAMFLGSLYPIYFVRFIVNLRNAITGLSGKRRADRHLPPARQYTEMKPGLAVAISYIQKRLRLIIIYSAIEFPRISFPKTGSAYFHPACQTLKPAKVLVPQTRMVSSRRGVLELKE